MKILLSLILFLLSTYNSLTQDWHANGVWGTPVPVINRTVHIVDLPFPNSSLQYSTVAFLTTTNIPTLIGDMTGKTITATFQIIESNSPIYFLHTTSQCDLPPNVRLFFTTTIEPYYVDHANHNETAYWWADYAYVCLGMGQWSLSATLDPSGWSDALGHFASDTNYTDSFLFAVSNVHQVGFSFGGGCFFDVGVGVIDGGSSTMRLLKYQAVHPYQRKFPIPHRLEYELY